MSICGALRPFLRSFLEDFRQVDLVGRSFTSVGAAANDAARVEPSIRRSTALVRPSSRIQDVGIASVLFPCVSIPYRVRDSTRVRRVKSDGSLNI